MTATIRANRELKKCMSLEHYDIEVDDNILKWKLKFSPNTKIFKKTYNMELNIPSDYPFKAPELHFTEYIYHPNIDRNGKMCLGMLSEWKPSYNISSVLETVYSSFVEPNLDNPINAEAANLWSSNLEAYIKKLK